MDRKSKITIITSVLALAIVTIIVTYAYFSARITGLESASTISLTAGTMGIHYAEGNETVSVSNIYPKSDPWVTKIFTLTGNNTTAIPMEYEVGLQIITNTFKGGQLSFSLEVGNNNDGTSMAAVTNKAITGSNHTIKIGSGSFPGPVTNGVQTYTLKIYFLDTGKDQNINQGAVFNGKITVGDKGSMFASVPVNECTDTVHTTLTQGDEYVNGQYTYRYMQSIQPAPPYYIALDWVNITDDGWGVVQSDVIDYEASLDEMDDVIATQLCTSINGKPIVSMSYMFDNSQATSIDLSSFDTSHVSNMTGMFRNTKVATLDLSTFDTSNVTDMRDMFDHSQATSIDLSSFDTSNVTDMIRMFYGSAATTLDLSSFDTSNVTIMNDMFHSSAAAALDLSSFDTSSVTHMQGMFYSSAATTINVTSFDTSSVTDMQSMFNSTVATTLDLSSFDTSNATNMNYMFSNSSATTGYARSQSDVDRFNASSNKPAGLTFVVK